jgi:hypothetical protein
MCPDEPSLRAHCCNDHGVCTSKEVLQPAIPKVVSHRVFERRHRNQRVADDSIPRVAGSAQRQSGLRHCQLAASTNSPVEGVVHGSQEKHGPLANEEMDVVVNDHVPLTPDLTAGSEHDNR